MTSFDGLPGADLVVAGRCDLEAGVVSVEALLVSIAAPSLRQLGVSLTHVETDPEHRLYQRLAQDDVDGAHARYNSLVRRIVSFERALACVG